MRDRRSAAIAASCVLLATGACALDLDRLRGGPRDGAAGDAAVTDANADAAGGDSTTTADADGGLPSACGKASLLADDFETDTLNTALWYAYQDPGTTVSLTGGKVELTLDSNLATSSWAVLSSRYYYDLTESRVSVEVIQSVNVATFAEMALVLRRDDQNELALVQQVGLLRAVTQVGSDRYSSPNMLYNPSAHRFWQIRESGGTTYWETSPDGASWTAFWQGSTPSFAPLVRASFEIGTSSFIENPGAAHIDNFNGGVPTGRACPASSLTDDFATDTSAWLNSFAPEGAACRVQTGVAEVAPATGERSEAAFGTSTYYDLTGSSVTVEVPRMVSTAAKDAYAYLELYSDSPIGSGLLFWQQGGTLSAFIGPDSDHTSIADTGYVPSQHAWWRIREQGGVVYWDTSGDGREWTNLVSHPTPFSVATVSVWLGAGTSAAVSDVGTVCFDNYNLPP
jgi:hypothetical protein